MLNQKKANIPRAVYDQWILDLNKVASASFENIGNKFKNAERDIFNEDVRIFEDTLARLAPEALGIFNTMRAKNTWLLRHSVNVAVLSLLMTRQLGLGKQETQKILTGALLHDVGKMVISGSILQKPAALTAEEIDIIRRHPLSGYHMVMKSLIPEESKLIVLQHHERLDGSGYPYELNSEALTDGAKIVMVADSLDAMTSYRPYKTAQSMPKAIQSIQKDGCKYDQDLILSLKRLLPKVPLSTGRHE